MKEYLSINELSEYLRIKKSTLYSKVESKQIPHYKIGRLIRFKKSQIDKWMEDLQMGFSAHNEPNKKGLKSRKPIDAESHARKIIAEMKAREYNSGMGNQA